MSDEVYAQLDESERLLRESSARLDQLQGLAETLGALVGSAEAEDGLVRVEVTGAGVSELVIAPKAMRLPSEELADLVERTLTEANDDLRRRTTRTLSERGLLAGSQDREEVVRAARERMQAAGAQLNSSMRSAMERMPAAQQRFGAGR